jgi:pyruvate dehydrogenase E2 component (dihydrolipoyllysine-residue acetyltransferase)
MAETITMPKLGFDMAEGTLVRWVKQEGEQINKGDVLAEIETDKATVEVESHASGTVLRLLVSQGDVVPVNAAIAVVGEKGEKVEAGEQTAAGSKQAAGGQQKEEKGKKDEGEEQQAAGSKQAPVAAVAPMPSAPPPVPAKTAPVPADGGPVKASPLAKKIAADRNVSLAALTGTGPGGRIVRRDIEAALAGGAVRAPLAASAAPPAPMTMPSFTPVSHEDETVKLSRLRQAIARRMTEAKQTAPHFYVTHDYEVDALLELRKQLNALLPEEQKISVNDFVVKAVALTLREFPNLNSSFAGENVVRHGAVNIGVAVAVEGGLLTVVCRDADQKPLRQLATEIKPMAARAREGKVRPDDIEGSTFSVSNLGMFDVENFSAIINPPEAGILAVGSAREVPVVEDGQIKAGWRMKATVSVDHRVSDGAEGARFMQALAKYLEEPLRLLV